MCSWSPLSTLRGVEWTDKSFVRIRPTRELHHCSSGAHLLERADAIQRPATLRIEHRHPYGEGVEAEQLAREAEVEEELIPQRLPLGEARR